MTFLIKEKRKLKGPVIRFTLELRAAEGDEPVILRGFRWHPLGILVPSVPLPNGFFLTVVEVPEKVKQKVWQYIKNGEGEWEEGAKK